MQDVRVACKHFFASLGRLLAMAPSYHRLVTRLWRDGMLSLGAPRAHWSS